MTSDLDAQTHIHAKENTCRHADVNRSMSVEMDRNIYSYTHVQTTGGCVTTV